VTEWLIDAHCTYQAGLDVEKLAEEGYSALVVKATQGSSGYWAPPAFDDWIRRARAAGMIPGAYHWINNTNPVEQVDYFLRRLSSVGGPNGMLIQLDCEDTASPATAATVTLWIREWNRRTGNHPLLFYSGAWWYPAKLGSFRVADVAPNVHQWDSHYVTGGGYASALYESVPAGWWIARYGGFGEVTVMQFSSSGRAGGLAGGVDVNAFRGTRAELHALTGGKPEMELTDPVPATGQNVGVVLSDMWNLILKGHSGFVATDLHFLGKLGGKVDELVSAVNAVQVGGIDLDALATKVAALLPAPPTAVEVAQELAKRLGNG
jgi:GH25 family lysozyme M1 (1,4-beta-N-acetylmuramidase)